MAPGVTRDVLKRTSRIMLSRGGAHEESQCLRIVVQRSQGIPTKVFPWVLEGDSGRRTRDTRVR